MLTPSYITPAVTVFTDEGEIDHAANRTLWDHLIESGMDGIVVMGSIGEFFSMTPARRVELLNLATSHIRGRAKLYLGTGCMTFPETVELSTLALRRGADAVMLIGPYYFALPDDAVERYYDGLAEKIRGEICLYSFPDRTGYDIAPGVTLNLLRKHRHITGYKDTTADMGHTRALLTATSGEFPDFCVLSGYDEFFVHNILSGGGGSVGGLSNIYPELFSAWVAAARIKDFAKMSAIQKITDRLMEIYAIGKPFIPIIKKAAQMRGILPRDASTPPMCPADARQVEQIHDVLARADAMIAAL